MTDPRLDIELPNDVDAERIVLGTVLQAPRYLDELSLSVDEFYLDSHRRIFRTASDLLLEGCPVEYRSICGRLQDTAELERVGGMTFVASLIDGVPISDPHYYAERVHSKWLQRICINTGNAIASQALEAENGRAAVEYAQYAVQRLDEGQTSSGDATPAGEAASAYLEELERTAGRAPDGVRTGLRDLDDVVVTLEPETLIVVGARTSNGKTALGLILALNVATAGTMTAIFSLEMNERALIQRLLSMTSGVSLQSLRRRVVGRDDWRRLFDATQTLDTLPIVIDDTRGLTAGQVCARMRRLKQKSGLGLVIVDFLTRLRFNASRDLRHEVGDAAKMFKDASGELSIPVVALSQLSRASVTGVIRKPQLSDLRESGNLEEDADTVIFVHRDEIYHPTDENRGKAELIVAKQRQGPAPVFVQVAFNGDLVKFENL